MEEKGATRKKVEGREVVIISLFGFSKGYGMKKKFPYLYSTP
jgi:hypothetical protein